ncbi:lytic transglycosylase, catalytic [gamma proteobacterium BDW918]|nr:lytic transglycosylase, catalytic [gamma proteobacterium BDW918]
MRLAAIVLLMLSAGAHGDVPAMYREVAKEKKVPETIFYALVLNESRSLVDTDGKRRVLPWPWTINHRGEPHYFPSKQAAIQYAQSLVRSGDRLFDIGLAQVNWHHHSHRFTSLESAFEPRINLTAAAGFLREQYERKECSTWELAVGCYHRPGQRAKDKAIAKKYSDRVINLWVSI